MMLLINMGKDCSIFVHKIIIIINAVTNTILIKLIKYSIEMLNSNYKNNYNKNMKNT